MSNSQCCLGWSLSIGCWIDLCTQVDIQRLGSMSHLMFTTSNMHCIRVYIFRLTPLSSIWVKECKTILSRAHNETIEIRIPPWKLEMSKSSKLKTILSRLALTPLRQGYPLENEGCQIFDASEIQPPDPLTQMSMPLRCLLSFLQISDFKEFMNLLPRVFRHDLWEWPSQFKHTRGLTNIEAI